VDQWGLTDVHHIMSTRNLTLDDGGKAPGEEVIRHRTRSHDSRIPLVPFHTAKYATSEPESRDERYTA
jgi:hypothetical protein